MNLISVTWASFPLYVAGAAFIGMIALDKILGAAK